MKYLPLKQTCAPILVLFIIMLSGCGADETRSAYSEIREEIERFDSKLAEIKSLVRDANIRQEERERAIAVLVSKFEEPLIEMIRNRDDAQQDFEYYDSLLQEMRFESEAERLRIISQRDAARISRDGASRLLSYFESVASRVSIDFENEMHIYLGDIAELRESYDRGRDALDEVRNLRVYNEESLHYLQQRISELDREISRLRDRVNSLGQTEAEREQDRNASAAERERLEQRLAARSIELDNARNELRLLHEET